MQALDDSTLAGRVKRARLKKGLTHEQVIAKMPGHARLGEVVTYARNWMTSVENGTKIPTLAQLEGLAEILDRDAWWLAWGDRTGDTELVGLIRSLEPDLDDRGVLTVELVAQQQAAFSRGDSAFGFPDGPSSPVEPTPFRPRPRAPGGRSLEQLPPGVTRGLPPAASEPPPSELTAEEEQEAGEQRRQLETEATQEPGERIVPEQPAPEPPPTTRRRARPGQEREE